MPALKVILRSFADNISAPLLAEQPALEHGNDQGDRDQHRGDEVQVLRLQADEIAVQRQRDEEAVDDGADDDGQRGQHQLPALHERAGDSLHCRRRCRVRDAGDRGQYFPAYRHGPVAWRAGHIRVAGIGRPAGRAVYRPACAVSQ